MNITTANDTVCLLLSGLSVTDWQDLTAGVIGTGINFAFFSDATKVINTEAANFNKFSQSDEAKQIDRESVSPGSALFEKEIAGAYLYQHYNQQVKTRHLPFSPLTQTHELDVLAQEETEEGKLARNLLRRSAQLSAALIAGVTMFKGHDTTCVLEGSLFWKGYRYKEVVDETVSSILTGQTITFIKIADSPLLGAAYLVG
jgi:hexokinase